MKVVDVVCDKTVLTWWASMRGLQSEVGAKDYYFCSNECKAKFDGHPASYTMAEDQGRASDDGMPSSSQDSASDWM